MCLHDIGTWLWVSGLVMVPPLQLVGMLHPATQARWLALSAKVLP